MAGLPISLDMQGLSLVPLLQGKNPASWRQSIYYHYYEYPAIHMVNKHEGVYDGHFKLIHFYELGEWEFYDLEKDPQEMNNVYEDPGYAEEVQRLKEELEKLKTHYKVPKKNSYVYGP